MVITFTGKKIKIVCAVLRVWPAQHLFLLGQLSDNVRVKCQPLKFSFILESMDLFYSWQQQQESEQHNNWDHLEILSSSYCLPCV